ncbi:hypothetical protein ABZU76_03050 [Amycolatopsis sp. NPDC005232]|uniref:hypothetical protein n=1 Tax=Amycolatopsis sp. NPDC005232 TaxID=3157027 RepID=UPI0033A4AA86
MNRSSVACAAAVVLLAAASCAAPAAPQPAPVSTSASPPTAPQRALVSPPAAPLSATSPPPSPTRASAPPQSTSTPRTTRTSPKPKIRDTRPGCGQRAVNARKFNPSCKEYQGYLDPGGPGRGKTSGETQREWLCEQGQLPKNEC